MKKKLALDPEVREQKCDHVHAPYSGQIPCTGPRICSMCGSRIEKCDECGKDTAVEELFKIPGKKVCSGCLYGQKKQLESGLTYVVKMLDMFECLENEIEAVKEFRNFLHFEEEDSHYAVTVETLGPNGKVLRETFYDVDAGTIREVER